MSSAQEDFHQFEYDLWQNETRPTRHPITPGLTTTVANYFARAQDAVLLHDRGSLLGLQRGGGVPRSNEQFKLSSERLESRNYNVVLIGDQIAEGFFSTGDRKAIITAHLWPQDGSVKLVHYFAFFVAVAILKHQIPDLTKHGGANHCPFDAATGDIDLVRMISRGSLCEECQYVIDGFMKKGALDPSFMTSIGNIFEAIASEYRQTAKLDPSQQATSEDSEVHTETVDITSDSEIKDKEPEPLETETPTTGNFGIDSDTGAPEDALGYRDYAKALAAVICDKTTGMPLTLAVCAPWGRGKTALLDFLKDEINNVNNDVKKSKEPEKHDQRRAGLIDFNAWTHSKSDAIWAAFYASIFKKIEDTLNLRGRLSLRWYVWKQTHPGKFWSYISTVGLLVLIAAYSHFSQPDDANGMVRTQVMKVIEHNPENDTTATLVISEPKKDGKTLFALGSLEAKDLVTVVPGLLAFLGVLWGALLSLKRGMLGKVKKSGADLLPLTEEDVIGYFRNVSKWLRKRCVRLEKKGLPVALKDRLPNRFVVFIDDIDRVQPGKILQMMEAIKLFQDTERFIFVLAMDTRVLRFAIGNHYKFMSEDLRHQEEMGRFYLEKMIQVPFHLPELTPSQRLSLNEKILARHLKEIVRTPESTRVGFSTRGPTVTITSENGEVIEHRPAAEKPAPVSPVRKTENKQDAAVRSGITTQEHDVIKDLLNNEEFDISPRLLKRFINVYMIARHILILGRQSKYSSIEEPIPESFIKWLAVSVRYPWGTRALLRWLELNDWHSPFSPNQRNKNPVFSKNGRFLYRESELKHLEDTAWTVPAQEPFNDMRISDMDRFGRLLVAMDLDWTEVRDTLHITNCFNLVLD